MHVVSITYSLTDTKSDGFRVLVADGNLTLIKIITCVSVIFMRHIMCKRLVIEKEGSLVLCNA